VLYTDQTFCVAHSLTFADSCLCWTLQLDWEFVWSTVLTADCSQRCVCVCVCVLVHNTTDCTLGTFSLPASVIVNAIHTQGLAGKHPAALCTVRSTWPPDQDCTMLLISVACWRTPSQHEVFCTADQHFPAVPVVVMFTVSCALTGCCMTLFQYKFIRLVFTIILAFK